MQIKSYEGAVKYLENFIGKVVFNIDPASIKLHPPLDRMKMLLSLLDNPQEKFKSVLVGGTSGKGSTAYLISHILTTAGYKTGLTISPHLQKINERLQVNGKSISDEKFTQMIGSIVQTIELMKKMDVGAPSYFEILIAMAFLYFVKQKVDIAVVEVGMGGEFDATNTLYPKVSVLTNVSLDHTNVLGGTVQKIARTKVGIIKGSHRHPELGSGSPAHRQVSLQQNEMLKQVQHDNGKELIVVTGVKQLSVIKIVEDRCKEVGARVFRLYKDFDFKVKKEGLGDSVFDLTTTHDRGLQLNDLRLSLLGKHQVGNASLAIETVLQLGQFGFRVSEEDIRQALKTAFFPGRFEIIKCHPEFISGSVSPSPVPSPLEGEGQGEGKMLKQSMKQVQDMVQHDKEKTIILDGAHNPTKMKAFLTTLKKHYPKQKKIFVVGFKFDKDVKKMLKQILPVADTLIATEFHTKIDTRINAGMDAGRVIKEIEKLRNYDIKKIFVENNSKKAIYKALSILVSQYPNIDSMIVVTGSLYLVGEVRDML